MNKKVVIWGVTGQMGSYLTELFLSNGYDVIGIKRRTSTNNMTNLVLANVLNNSRFTIIEGDITDSSSINQIMSYYQPDFCVNTAAQSHVFTSFQQPSYTFSVNATGVLFLLDAIRNYSKETRLVQCSTSEMFGDNYSIDENRNKYQDENTPLSPNSPYATAKVAAHNLIKIYRDAYDIHCSAIIMFNNESPRRGEEFVTRKISKWIANNVDITYIYPTLHSEYRWSKIDKITVKQDCQKLKLGNLNAMRDWGYTGDFAKAIFTMLQQKTPDDYVICTGETHSIKEFLTEAFVLVGHNWEDWVEIDESLKRPCEVPYLCGRYDKAKRVLGWEPKVTFKELVRKMVLGDLNVQG